MKVYVEDITDKKNREFEEKTNAKRYQLAIRGANLAVWEYDIANRRLIVPNDSMKSARETSSLTAQQPTRNGQGAKA